MPFATVALRPNEERTLGDCALTHAALCDPVVAGSATRIFLDGTLICCLSDGLPQMELSINIGSVPVVVRCEGGSGVHLLGRAANSAATPEREHRLEQRAAQKKPPPLPSPPARTSADAAAAAAADASQQQQAQQAPTPGSGASSSSTRTPRLRFNPEVLYAEYIPKKYGISPERCYMSLDDMEARAEQRALEEAENGEYDEYDDDDEDYVEGYEGDSMSMEAFQEMLRHASVPGAGGGGRGGGGDNVYDRLAALIMREQHGMRVGGIGGAGSQAAGGGFPTGAGPAMGEDDDDEGSDAEDDDDEYGEEEEDDDYDGDDMEILLQGHSGRGGAWVGAHGDGVGDDDESDESDESEGDSEEDDYDDDDLSLLDGDDDGPVLHGQGNGHDDDSDDEPRIVEIDPSPPPSPPSPAAVASRAKAPTKSARAPPPPPPSALQVTLHGLSKALLKARTLLLCNRDVLGCAEAAEEMRSALKSLPKPKGKSASVDVAKALSSPLNGALAAVGTLLSENSPPPPAGLVTALLALDEVYFEMVYMGLSHRGSNGASPATLLLSEPDGIGADDDAMAVLVRSPGTFFRRSHTDKWRARLREKLASNSAEHLTPPSATDLANGRRGWCSVVARDHRRRLHGMLEHAAAAAEGAAGSIGGGGATTAGVNTLLATWRERTLEAIDVLDGVVVARPGGANGYDSCLPPSAVSKRDDEPPAPPLVQQWRKMDRQWPCWALAFAVPSEEAISLLASVGPIVEMGAGTGYWAHLLRSSGVDVTAFDATPTPQAAAAEGPKEPGAQRAGRGGAKHEEPNEFHGDCPSFTAVHSGGPSTLAAAKWSQHTLLLCYPPPKQPMALQCVQSFSGDTIAHVGEWHGDTGSTEFEALLASEWQCTHRLPLPNWGDTMEDLTLWRRRKAPLTARPTVHPVLACDACGKAASLRQSSSSPASKRARTDGGEGVQLRRCRYCRLACYCSAECEAAARGEHEQYHALKQIRLRRPLAFGGRDYHDV